MKVKKMKVQKITTYKKHEAKNEHVKSQRTLTASIEKILTLRNQSQVIDAIKHSVIDASLKNCNKLDTVANEVYSYIVSNDSIVTTFFKHDKFSDKKMILARVKAHLSCDSRHNEKRFDKRQVQIINVLK